MDEGAFHLSMCVFFPPLCHHPHLELEEGGAVHLVNHELHDVLGRHCCGGAGARLTYGGKKNSLVSGNTGASISPTARHFTASLAGQALLRWCCRQAQKETHISGYTRPHYVT
eukprot:1139010-Pelagomonas_calceolata.AAC.6